ncbi:uridine kinase [Candidatus Pelagibacter bacterium]|jgi:D-glycerate 3-kinase|nr:uridine kinase [Candidatus Pelagibacter bacterium]
MEDKRFNYQKVKKKYLKFLSSQEVMSEPFRDKLGQLNRFYLPMSKMIKNDYTFKKQTKIIGLTGGQGTGKSTISNILKIILKEAYNLETVIFSIDDFYKTLKERKKMSRKISNLFLTRGVPGTHDTKMLFRCLKMLKINNFKKINIPKFDKSIDDRSKKNKWLKVKKKPNIVIFEGWCVGATAQKNKDLNSPINKLEKLKDNKKIWRQKVNLELKRSYKKIFNLIDKLIFLKVPSFKYVFKWRLLQEKKLRITSKGNKTMNDKQIENFVMFYERITKNMIKILSKKADVVIGIDKKHRLKSIKFN